MYPTAVGAGFRAITRWGPLIDGGDQGVITICLGETEALDATPRPYFDVVELRKGLDWTPYPIYYFDPRAYNLKVTS